VGAQSDEGDADGLTDGADDGTGDRMTAGTGDETGAGAGSGDVAQDGLSGPAGALVPAERMRLSELLTFPVRTGAGLSVLNNFGGRSVSTGACSHRGIDIFPTDSPDDETYEPRLLVACADGVIEGQRFAPGSGSQGNAWILHDDLGVSYRYHHIDEFEPGLQVGSVVRAGDVIATMGTTGNANFPHLHFEIRPNGTGASAVDPVPLLAFPEQLVTLGPKTGCS